MKFTLSWLKEFLDTNASVDEISIALTNIGLEVEEIIDRSKGLKSFTIAEIIEAQPHPNANKLKLCKVDSGNGILDIVCGAHNARAGIKVVLAKIGAIIPTNGMEIKESEIRGYKSNGMMCSERELGLGNDHDGIIEIMDKDLKVGSSFVDYYQLDDPIIEISLTPNRGDCLGVYGIARDLSAYGIGKLKSLQPQKIDFSKYEKGKFKITKLDPAISDQIIFVHISNLQNKESPSWLKQRLQAIGLNPISALVDITNYISYCYGRPSHVYDADLISDEIAIQFASNEKFTALDEQDYQLSADIATIADDKNILAIAGVIGSHASGCSLDTKNILLEIADFNSILVAKNGRKLGINSDARYRFEREIDKAFLTDATSLLVNLIQEICGGEVNQIISKSNKNYEHKKIDFDYDLVKKITAVDINKNQCDEILKNLGFTVNVNEVTVPGWRNDVCYDYDLVEEILRIYGFDKIEDLELPKFNNDNKLSGLPIITLDRLSELRKNLASRGLSEVVSFSFTNEKILEYFTLNQDLVPISNPISQDLSHMRCSIIPNLINIIDHNIRHGIHNSSFFEIGPIFFGPHSQDQADVITGIRCGNYFIRNHFHEKRPVDIWDVKADLYALIEEFGLSTDNISISRNTPDYYHPGKSGALMLGKNILGYFGAIHPKIIKSLKINCRDIVIFETTDLKKFPVKNKKSTQKQMLRVSEFPIVERDLAFILDKNITAEQVVKIIKSVNRDLIFDVNIFDVYAGDKIADDKKSIAVSYKMKPKNNTLTDEEIHGIMNKIIDDIQNKLGASLRDQNYG